MDIDLVLYRFDNALNEAAHNVVGLSWVEQDFTNGIMLDWLFNDIFDPERELTWL